MGEGLVGAVAGFVTALLGGVAAIVAAIARRNSDKETHEEAAQRRVQEERDALTREYRGLLEELRLHGAEMERRHEAEATRIRQRLSRVEEEVARARDAHAACEAQLRGEVDRRAEIEARLRVAEARILELGG